MFNSSSALDYGSGSTYMWYNLGQSKNPYGGVSQYGYIVRSQYNGTTVGSSSYNNSLTTASQAIWFCRPTFNDQSDNSANTINTLDALDANHSFENGAYVHGLTLKVVTGSVNGIGKMITSLEIGPVPNDVSVGTYSSVGGSGAFGGIKMVSGSIYAPGSFGTRLGNLGIVSYTNQVRLGNDDAGDGYIAFGSGSNASGMMGTPPASSSLALVTSNGNIVISTGLGGLFSGMRTIIYGSQSTTGSINSTGFINLPRGNSVTLGISSASELMTGSIAFDTGSMNVVVFTGNGSTTFAGSTGWKVVTLT